MRNYNNNFNVNYLDLYFELLNYPDGICEVTFILATLKIHYEIVDESLINI